MSFQLLVFDSRRGNNEGEEEDKVLGFYPDSTPNNERVSLAGLLQGLHIFSGSLERPQVGRHRQVVSIQKSDQNNYLA
jgi:First Longin domain of INTU, CCZ1 and HPS4